LFHHSSETRQPASTTPALQSAESSLHPTTSNSLRVSKPSTGGVDHGQVTHKVIPDVPPNARNTITGTVRVIVKVAVDASGAVSHASLISRGPSEYFANQALQAARKWAFTPPTIDGRAIPSEWSLTFEFKSNGTKAVAQRT
jgi:TonB family protein